MILSFKAHSESVAEAENMKKTVAEMQRRQAAFENILKKMVASDLDVDIHDPQEQKQIDKTLEKVLIGKWQLYYYFK
jgi:hypothetical protein